VHDLLVLGDCNPDLLIPGDDLAFEFGQREKLVSGMLLTVGGSASITACGAPGVRTEAVRGVKSTFTKGEIIPIVIPLESANPTMSNAVTISRPR